MRIPIILAIPILFLCSACDDDVNIPIEKTTSLDINIKANYGEEDLELLNIYEHNGMPIRFSGFKFYISNFVLMKKNEITNENEETELFEIDFVDFGASSEKNISNLNVPIGEYRGIKFGIGVNAELNKGVTEDYAANHPLANTALYWDDHNSYVFSQISGQIDSDINGDFDLDFNYKLGRDVVYNEAIIFKPVELLEDATGQLFITIDMKEIMNYMGQEPVDIIGHNFTNGADSDLDLMDFFMDNFSKAVDFNQ